MLKIRSLWTLSSIRTRTNDFNNRGLKQTISRINPEYDTNYLTNPVNHDEIKSNILNRKGVGNIEMVSDLLNKLNQTTDATVRENLQNELQVAMKSIPNRTHPDVLKYGEKPMEIDSVGSKPKFGFKPKQFTDLCSKLNILRTRELGNFNGSRSYYLMNELAELVSLFAIISYAGGLIEYSPYKEVALIRYTVDKLKVNGFELISVPEILPPEVIEGCGMKTSGERNQVYKTLPDNLCLSGTSELALAGYFAGKRFQTESLPIRVMAVSRCYRAEAASGQEGTGLFRVHSFTKVEMFSVCTPNQSEMMLDEFRKIEMDLFTKLNLHFVVLDMPVCDLGAPAYRKFDIEAWMPGRQMYGEISSCSNCTDYQARRLDIRCNDENGNLVHAHTVNGTACAVPRMLIAILENFQNKDGIDIPTELQKYLNNKTQIKPTKLLPVLKLVKQINESDVA